MSNEEDNKDMEYMELVKQFNDVALYYPGRTRLQALSLLLVDLIDHTARLQPKVEVEQFFKRTREYLMELIDSVEKGVKDA